MIDSPQEIPHKILIVKTSSLGDIIQSFGVLDYLHKRYPKVQIDWIAEEGGRTLLESHPLISNVLSCNTKSWKSGFWKKKTLFEIARFFQTLRKTKYDLLFDLQGNSKSALWTFLARSELKVGFGRESVREWPNLLATHKQWNIPTGINIRLQHIELLKRHFQDQAPYEPTGSRLKITDREQEKLKNLLSFPGKKKVMVCPGSKWSNKQLDPQELKKFLILLSEKYGFSFLLFWGNPSEKRVCEELLEALPQKGQLVDLLPIPLWQNLMNDVDLVLAVDSSALHLVGTTKTPSFSFFGPTAPVVFKPMGERHHAIHGECPYKETFQKQCPLLRTCKTGACIKNLKAEELFTSFSKWWEKL